MALIATNSQGSYMVEDVKTLEVGTMVFDTKAKEHSLVLEPGVLTPLFEKQEEIPPLPEVPAPPVEETDKEEEVTKDKEEESIQKEEKAKAPAPKKVVKVITPVKKED